MRHPTCLAPSRVALAALALCASTAQAQTSGTIGLQTSSNWDSAPWIITAGVGAFPGAGGMASFLQPTNTVVGTLTNTAVPVITLTAPVNLASLTLDSPFQMAVAGTALNNLTLATGTLNVLRANVSTLSSFAAGHVVSVPLGGNAGLTKTGGGTVTITGTNTFTGGTTVNAGTLRITTGDAALGAAGAGNDLSINNANFRISTTALTTARNVTVSGNSTLELFAIATVNGVLGGSGTLVRDIGSTLTMAGANTFTGTYVQRNGSTTLNGASGALAAATAYDFSNTLNLDSVVANNSNRLSDSASFTSRSLTMTLTGNAGAATAEQAGALTLASGTNVFNIGANAAQQASLRFASITRSGNAVLSVRGTNLGAAAANGVAQFGSTAAVGGLAGGSGAAGTTTVSIVPWATGNVASATSTGSSFVTVDGSGNWRPLSLATEYLSNSFAGATPDSNVRISAVTAAPAGGVTVNSLLVQGTAVLTTTGTDTITLSSGALMYSPTAALSGTLAANINFGAAEGVVTNTGTLTLSGVLSGSGGLTRATPTGNALTLSGANTYTGPTTLLSGTTTFAGTVANDGVTPGPLGLDTSAVVINAGATTATRIWVNGNTTFNRDLVVGGVQFAGSGTSGTVGLGSSPSGSTITMNGGVLLNRQLTIETGSTVADTATFNGVVSGPGSLTDAFTSRIVLANANTYSGGTEMAAGTWIAANNAGFGTGPINVVGATTTAANLQTQGARTLANPVVFLNNLIIPVASDALLTLSGPINLNGVPRTLTVVTPNGLALTGLVSDGGLNKAGVGTLTLNRPAGQDYSGGTIVAGGTLNVLNSAGSGTGGGTVQVQSPGRLTGDFIVAGATQLAGTLSPGNGGNNAIGAARFGASLAMTSSAVANFELASTSSFDSLVVGGAYTLAGLVTVNLISGYSPALGASFNLIDWGSLDAAGFTLATGLDFSGAPLSPGLSWDSSRFISEGTVQVVPEPGSWALMLGGLAAVSAAALRRRRG